MTDAADADEISPEALDRISARALEEAALRNLQRRIGEANTAKDNTPPASEGRQG